MLLFNNVLIVLSRAKEIVAEHLSINQSNIKDTSVLFDLGASYIDVLEICKKLEDEFPGPSIAVDNSNFHTLKIEDIANQVSQTAVPVSEISSRSERALNFVTQKTKEFFRGFYEKNFGEDCPEFDEESDLGLHFGLESLQVSELQLAVENFFSVNLEIELRVSLPFKDLVNIVFDALVSKAKQSTFATT